MKTLRYSLTVIALLTGISSFGQVSVTGTAYTEIVPLVTAREKVQMNLGRFSTDKNGGSLVLTPEGFRIARGSVILLNSFASQAVFVISGSSDNSLSVLLPSTPQPLIHNRTSNRIFLENWTYDIPKTNDGKIQVNVGATLEVGPESINPPGEYTGTYQVVFIFN
ncbi:MAG TPA: DUF4402 domain-containing protein [Bacteroidales bacterium]|nr:DUF4402 domain-containing protein [Bacteroidales bacterium]